MGLTSLCLGGHRDYEPQLVTERKKMKPASQGQGRDPGSDTPGGTKRPRTWKRQHEGAERNQRPGKTDSLRSKKPKKAKKPTKGKNKNTPISHSQQHTLCQHCQGKGYITSPIIKIEQEPEPTIKKDSTENVTKQQRYLRFGIINDGKLSAARSLLISGWMQSKNINICFVSEAAHPGKSELTTYPGYQWAVPLNQKKGGSGFLIQKNLLSSKKVKLYQAKNLNWSIATCQLDGLPLLVSVYLNPEASRDIVQLYEFLGKLTETVTANPSCVIAGDLNLPKTEVLRPHFNQWVLKNNFHYENEYQITHWMTAESVGTDIDVCLTRETECSMLWMEKPAKGHARIVAKIPWSNIPKMEKETPWKLDWNRLRDEKIQKVFQTTVEKLIEEDVSLNEAITTAGLVCIGEKKSIVRNQLPRTVRKKIRKLRREAKRMQRGTNEHLSIVMEIGAILRRFRIKHWKKKMRKMIASKVIIQEDTWKLINNLRRARTVTRSIGVEDEEVQEAYKEVYNSNKCHRPDWTLGNIRNYVKRGSRPEKTKALDKKFDSSEVLEAIRSLPNKKSPGIDGITHEVYKALQHSEKALSHLLQQYNGHFENGYKGFTEGRLVVIPKGETPNHPLKMRPLTMLPTERKILEKMIANRLKKLSTINKWDGMHDLQGGFRQNMGINRQLLLTQLAIADSQQSGRQLYITSLDVVKAFDRLPRHFASHCAGSYLTQYCPKLAKLVTELTLSPMKANINQRTFKVSTGVPQGGILSPWLFVMTMNDLARRLEGTGYTLSTGTAIGALLYADDILLLGDHKEIMEQNLTLTKEWLKEWGGELNEAKTENLEFKNTDYLLPKRQNTGSIGNNIVNYLGMHITHDGVVPKIGKEELLKDLGSIYAVTDIDALSPALALQIIRSISWTKISLGFAVALPETTTYVRYWHRVARRIFHAFDCTHGVEIQKELGLLYHPLYWICKDIITFYGTIFSEKKDTFLINILQENIKQGHPLHTRLEKILSPTGITWHELQNIPVKDCLRKAKARMKSWTSVQIKTEAKRLGIFLPECETWTKISDKPAKYLYEENARYGFLFRLHHFGPSTIVTEHCHFCQEEESDTGRHVLRCGAAREAVPLPKDLESISTEDLEKVLNLDNGCTSEQLKCCLEYCKELWKKRKELRCSQGKYYPTPYTYEHNAAFMEPCTLAESIDKLRTEVQPPLTIRRKLRKKQAEAYQDGQVVERCPTNRGRWDEDEDKRLFDAICEHGTGNNKILSECVGSRTPLQCSDRLRTKKFSFFLQTVIPSKTQGVRKGRWTAEEVERLIAIVQQCEGHYDPAQIAETLGNRTARQVSEKINLLLKKSLIHTENTKTSKCNEETSLKRAFAVTSSSSRDTLERSKKQRL